MIPQSSGKDLALIIIPVLSVIVLFFILFKTSLFSNLPTQLNIQPQILTIFDNRCNQQVKGIGNCLALRWGYQYNSATHKCEQKSVGGCSVDSPFVSLEECSKTCVKNWTPGTPYEILLNQGLINISGVSKNLTFDQQGTIQYTQAGDNKILTIIKDNTFQLNNDIVAVIQKYDNVVETKNTSSSAIDGAYILLFRQTGKNRYESQELVKFSNNSIYIKSFNLDNSILTTVYEEVPCGGQFPQCGTRFTKKFRIENNKLYPI